MFFCLASVGRGAFRAGTGVAIRAVTTFAVAIDLCKCVPKVRPDSLEGARQSIRDLLKKRCPSRCLDTRTVTAINAQPKSRRFELAFSFRKFIAALACALTVVPAAAQDNSIVVASTTSTEQSGLFGHLLPQFEKKSGIRVRVVALGTGQALDTGRRGDADVVFVHDKAAEGKFVADGFGVERKEVMYNDFILVGPKADPAGVNGGRDIAGALKKIDAAKAPFVSRGDRSGTHAAELRYWKVAGVDLDKAKGPWYRDSGSGMGAALNMAASLGAYILADRGTWLAFKNRQGLAIAVEGDPRLFNQYGVMLVNPVKYPHVKRDPGQQFINWLVSADGQSAIAAYKIGGEQLFFPNASK